jgi:proline dehydrogenase
MRAGTSPLLGGSRLSILDSFVATALPWTPRFVVGRVARRYIAGATLDDAVAAIRALNAAGVAATVDVLGEFITDFAEAEATAAEYARAQEAIARGGLHANVSVKLTAFGLGLDAGRCLDLVRGLARRAAEQRSFVRVDMENTPYTDATLAIVRTLRSEGLPVGAVLQAYLRRTEADAAALAAEGVPVRLCKGIYRESPEVAFQGREEIRASYRRCLRILLRGPARVAIATHDEILVADALTALAELAVPKEHYEFQMLLGVRERLRRDIVAKGHAMRVYVPYGAAWYGYSLRRLRENPAIAGHVFRSMLGRS